MPIFSNKQISTFLSLFRGREDVFAVRWEKDSKAGYMPAYDLNWVHDYADIMAGFTSWKGMVEERLE